MAIPTGSGTEVLKRTSITGLGGSSTYGNWWHVDWASEEVTSQASTAVVPAHHIITPISIIICNQHASNTYGIDMAVDTDISGGVEQFLLMEQSVPAKGTFVFNDKFVLHPSDALKFRVNVDASGDNFSVYISFIDQDWST
jgi:hypothetical protein